MKSVISMFSNSGSLANFTLKVKKQPSSVITERFVSDLNDLEADLTRNTFFAPSASPATMSSPPRST